MCLSLILVLTPVLASQSQPTKEYQWDRIAAKKLTKLEWISEEKELFR